MPEINDGETIEATEQQLALLREMGVSETEIEDLIAVVFPDIPEDAQLPMFTSFCPLCGGVQGVQNPELMAEMEEEDRQLQLEADSQPKRWWEFWK